jgi:hypothetical protein
MNSTTGTINENFLDEICEQPKSLHPHVVSLHGRSVCHAKGLRGSDARPHHLTLSLGFLSRVSPARFSKSSHTTTSILAGGSGDDDDSSKMTSTSNDSNAEEYHRFKVSHFIENAMKIIDAMEN